MTTPPFGRVLTAMVTPFTPDGAVDYKRAAELALRLVDECRERGAIGDVERQRDDAAAERAGGLLGQTGIEVADRDPAPLADQSRRGCLADPARTAGDRHHLPIQ